MPFLRTLSYLVEDDRSGHVELLRILLQLPLLSRIHQVLHPTRHLVNKIKNFATTSLFFRRF